MREEGQHHHLYIAYFTWHRLYVTLAFKDAWEGKRNEKGKGKGKSNLRGRQAGRQIGRQETWRLVREYPDEQQTGSHIITSTHTERRRQSAGNPFGGTRNGHCLPCLFFAILLDGSASKHEIGESRFEHGERERGGFNAGRDTHTLDFFISSPNVMSFF